MTSPQISTNSPVDSLQSDRSSENPIFADAVARAAVLLAANAIAVFLVSALKPGDGQTLWTIALAIPASLATVLPIGIGVAIMIVRGFRLVMPLAAIAAGLSTVIAIWHVWAIDTTQARISSAVCVALFELAVLSMSYRLSPRKIFPLPLRLAVLAFVFKLAIVGLLTAAFLPMDRNPLGWIVPSINDNPPQPPNVAPI